MKTILKHSASATLLEKSVDYSIEQLQLDRKKIAVEYIAVISYDESK